MLPFIDIGAKIALASNFIANFLVESALNYLWGLVHVMQIIAHFPLTDVLMPANCHMLFSVFVKIVTFDLIPVDKLMAQVGELYETEPETVNMKPNFVNFEYESTDPVKNLRDISLYLIAIPMISALIKLT